MDQEPEAPLPPDESEGGYASQERPEEQKQPASTDSPSVPEESQPVSKEIVQVPKPALPVRVDDGDEATKDEEEDGEGGPVKSFLEHLEDLRWVIIRVVAALGIAMAGCMVGAPAITKFLEKPLRLSGAMRSDGTPLQLQPLGPLDPFVITMKLALYGGIVIALPFMLYFVADYVLPALKKHEKQFFLRAFSVGAGLFLAGVAVAYFFVLPMTLRAAVQYSKWMGFDTDLWRAEPYFSFVTLLMVCMGASFEIPIIVLSLVKLGLIELEWLTKGRPYFFLITFGVVAFITPDFVSTFFLVIPLMVLMEICIWIARYWKRKEGKS